MGPEQVLRPGLFSTCFQVCCFYSSQLLYDDDAETTRNALLGCCLSLQITSDACVERLLDVWREVVHRVYNYYQLAAKAYFTYLQLNTQVHNLTHWPP